jgi:CRISPR/Cas system endoribonuclease Cas6 (RAMP superfamily)
MPRTHCPATDDVSSIRLPATLPDHQSRFPRFLPSLRLNRYYCVRRPGCVAYTLARIIYATTSDTTHRWLASKEPRHNIHEIVWYGLG